MSAKWLNVNVPVAAFCLHQTGSLWRCWTLLPPVSSRHLELDREIRNQTSDAHACQLNDLWNKASITKVGVCVCALYRYRLFMIAWNTLQTRDIYIYMMSGGSVQTEMEKNKIFIKCTGERESCHFLAPNRNNVSWRIRTSLFQPAACGVVVSQ